MIAFISLMFFSFERLRNDYIVVYRDEHIDELTTKVASGIWKGVYTTEQRANGVVELEEYLSSRTDASDRVLCLDWVSFGYLMVNGQICSPTTLDASAYSSYCNDPSSYYNYFDLMDTVPTKIIYIDFGRDDHLSIDDLDWKFSEFVLENYCEKDTFANDMVKVRICELDDLNKAMMFVNERTTL